jgi:hypothetical protein
MTQILFFIVSPLHPLKLLPCDITKAPYHQFLQAFQLSFPLDRRSLTSLKSPPIVPFTSSTPIYRFMIPHKIQCRIAFELSPFVNFPHLLSRDFISEQQKFFEERCGGCCEPANFKCLQLPPLSPSTIALITINKQRM